MAGNGDAQRLEKLEVAIRGDQPQPALVEEGITEFSIMELGRFLALHGQEQQELTRDYANRLLEMERRKMAYLEKIVGKMPK